MENFKLMFEEYKKEVRQYYLSQKAAHQLSSAMEEPERLKLKNECLRLFSSKNEKADVEIIKGFFNPTNKFDDEVKSIEKVELDRFRPIIKFIKRGSAIRDDSAVKLLAWLLNFEFYQDWRAKKYGTDNTYLPIGALGPEENATISIAGGELICSGNESPDIPKSDGKETDEKKLLVEGEEGVIKDGDTEIQHPKVYVVLSRKTLFTIPFIIFAITGLLLWKGEFHAVNHQPLKGEKCMYWSGNRYVATGCEIKVPGTKVIPLDIARYQNFRKIGWSDTLTRKSIGKIWYSKVLDEREYFTDSGAHPTDSSKILRPLTSYILSNHVSIYRFMLKILIGLIFISGTSYLLIPVMKKLLERKQ